jgi:hypothetical protein
LRGRGSAWVSSETEKPRRKAHQRAARRVRFPLPFRPNGNAEGPAAVLRSRGRLVAGHRFSTVLTVAPVLRFRPFSGLCCRGCRRFVLRSTASAGFPLLIQGYGNDSRQNGPFALKSDSIWSCEALSSLSAKAQQSQDSSHPLRCRQKWGSQSDRKPGLGSPSPKPGQRPERRRKR